MGRNLNEIIADLPTERQERIETLYQALKKQVEKLRAASNSKKGAG
jgi:hypothetical protein